MHKMDIFVDLDGTVVRTDLFVESCLAFIKARPFNLMRLLFWLARGRAVAKTMVARYVPLDPSSLPYERQLVDYLRQQKGHGRRIVLATASHRVHARSVASHLDLFDAVMASTSKCNLKGHAKLEGIRKVGQDRPFTYAGDSRADRPIWQAAASGIFVNAPNRDIEEARSRGAAERVLTTRRSSMRAFVEEMRPHQWAKNVLVFVPLFTSHAYLQTEALTAAALAFVAFCFCASGVYFLNDLLDIEADRRHASKRHRPLASGDLTIRAGVGGAVVLPLVAFALAAATLPPAFVAVLGLYYLTTVLYSTVLKRKSTLDVLTLAVLYTLRVLAGAVAIDVELSSWLFAFSIFLFVSLAYLKRYVEMAAIEPQSGPAPGRGYSDADVETMFMLGIANATASILVLALFVSSDEVRREYVTPDFLWLLCLLLLYWSNRLWIGARRGKINEDPVIFALRDRVSRLIGAAWVAVVVAARYIQI